MNCFNNLCLKQRIAALTAAGFIQAGLIGIMSRRPAISAPLPYGSKTVHLVSPQYDWQIIARTGYKLDGLTLAFNAPNSFGDVRMNEKGDVAFDAVTQEKGYVIFLNGKAIAKAGDMIEGHKIDRINSFFLAEDGTVDVFFNYFGNETCAYGAVERNGKLIFDASLPYHGETAPKCGTENVVNSWDDREYYLIFDTQVPNEQPITHILRHAEAEIENIPPNPHPSTIACSFNHKDQSVCSSYKDQIPYLVRDDQGVLPVPGIPVETAINDSGRILTSNLEMFNYNDVVTGNLFEQGEPYYLKIPYTTLLKHPLRDFQAPFGNVERTDQGLLIVPQQTAGRVVLKENNSVLLVIANPFVYKDKPQGSQETIILKGTLKTAAQNPPQTQKRPRKIIDIFIGGFGDTQINGHVVQKYSEQLGQSNPISTKYHTWDDGAGAVQDIANAPEGAVINVIGHSYGADTAARIVAGLKSRKVKYLILIDPVSRIPVADYPNPSEPRIGRTTRPLPPTWSERVLNRLRQAKQHADLVIDVDAQPGRQFDLSNVVAYIGGKWDKVPEGNVDIFLSTETSHAEFIRMMQKSWNAPLGTSLEQLITGH